MKRRDFVRTGAAAAMTIAVPHHPPWGRHAGLGIPGVTGLRAFSEISALTTLYDPKVQAMATQAVEAAQRAGAKYADVRCTNSITRGCPGLGQSAAVEQDVSLAMSVRSLVNGYWGWSSTNMLSLSEAIRVGQLSAQLATEAATRGRPRMVDLGTIPMVQNQMWKTPLGIDPFDVEVVEVYDWLRGIVNHLTNRGYVIGVSIFPPGIGVAFTREERLFASSDGSLTTQTVSTIFPAFAPQYRGVVIPIPGYNRLMQGGWELLVRHSNEELYALVETEREALERRPRLSAKPVDIGRYDIVYSSAAMAAILGCTLVPATEVDRALGYEANATGTSYLGPDPLMLLGTQVASPAVTVTAERSTQSAVATVKWDDEGVMPEPLTLVKDGMLTDYQTTREQAAWLAPWYHKQGQPVRSHGCAGAPSAGYVTMQHTPNIVLHPSTASTDDETLIAQVEHGLYVPSISVDMDFQCSNGIGRIPSAFEIRNGKRTAIMNVVGTLFRSADLWKNVTMVGGAKSAMWFDGARSRKGEPGRSTGYSICTVPALVKNQAIIDPMKKA